ELADEARLPETRRADQGDRLAALLGADALPCLAQRFELEPPPDERRVERPDLLLGRNREQSPGLYRLAVPLRVEGLERFCRHRVARERDRPLTDDDFTGLRRLFEPGRRGDSATGHESSGRSHDDFPALDADPALDSRL